MFVCVSERERRGKRYKKGDEGDELHILLYIYFLISPLIAVFTGCIL